MKTVRLGSLTTAEVVQRYIKPETERHSCRYGGEGEKPEESGGWEGRGELGEVEGQAGGGRVTEGTWTGGGGGYFLWVIRLTGSAGRFGVGWRAGGTADVNLPPPNFRAASWRPLLGASSSCPASGAAVTDASQRTGLL